MITGWEKRTDNFLALFGLPLPLGRFEKTTKRMGGWFRLIELIGMIFALRLGPPFHTERHHCERVEGGESCWLNSNMAEAFNFNLKRAYCKQGNNPSGLPCFQR
jgi:hypothetical protein